MPGELTNEVTLPEADVMRFVKTRQRRISLAKRKRSESLDKANLPWICAYLSIEADGDTLTETAAEAVLLNGRVGRV